MAPYAWVAVAFALGLSACGGGSGGDTGGLSSAAAPAAPTMTITNGSAVYALNTASLTASSTDPAGLPLTFDWDFGDGSSVVTGASVRHLFAAAGTYNLLLTARNKANVATSSTIPIQVLPSDPSTPQVTINNGAAVYAGTSASLSASSTDPLGRNLGYVWNFGDGQSATGGTVVHTYSGSGNYSITVKATNTASQSSSATQQITVLPAPVGTPTISSTPASPYAGQAVSFTGKAVSLTGLSLSYQWSFGDGSTGTGASVSHTYSGAGTYQVGLTVQDSAGFKAQTTFQQVILSTGAATTNALSVDCSGGNCGATSASSYSGTGVGTWRFVNSGASAALLNINIQGVRSGQTATLVFANTAATTAAQNPSVGVLSTPVAATASAGQAQTASRVQASERLASAGAEAQSHSELLDKNRQLLSLLNRSNANKTGKPQVATVRATSPSPTPAVGATRIWNDLFSTSNTVVPYTTSVAATCSLPSGRNVVFWLDPTATQAGLVSAADITAMQSAVCGPAAGFDRLNALMGDVWGPAASAYAADLIQDGSSLLDINIAIVNAPSEVGWAGYFYGLNNFLKSSTALASAANSNQALLFFINASQIQASRPYAISSLLHEATHMTNFYQRDVARNTAHDSWLEETSAMMSEDIVAPVVNSGYNVAGSIRVPSYMLTGGGTSYINWPQLSANNYALGGSFGAYLNRRYGLSIFQQLVTACNDGGTAPNDSYGCLDTLIKANGGLGFADDFAHFGAALFAPLSLNSAVDRYGLPARTDGGYTLGGIDASQYAAKIPTQATAIGLSGFTATSHYYNIDTLGAGASSYVRSNVSVPAGTTLLLVIR